MGRCFSTVYHLILVIFSVSALTFSILSATSCQFLTFDHQYKSGRYLSELNHGNNARALQVDGTPAVVGAAVPIEETVAVIDTVTTVAPDATVAATVTSVAATVAPDATVDETPAVVGAAVPIEETVAVIDTVATVAPDATVAETVASVAATVAPDADATVTAAAPSAADVPAPSPSVVATPTTPTTPKPTKGFNVTPMSPTEIQEAEGAAFGSSDTGSASAAEEPVATAAGDAGLYCDGEKSFSVTNLWKGTIQDLEAEIATESDTNQSEEVARNAVLAATVFGAIIAFVLVLESIIGWTVWCEKWILGLVTIMACICQGITFLFFNSQRYCDGDIVNEILNHKPCVMGQGGVFSVIATTLYGVILIMACRLPQDDPYGLCKSKKNRNTNTGNNKFMGGSGGDSAPLGTDDDEDGKPEKPNWLSEEERRDNEVNEVI